MKTKKLQIFRRLLKTQESAKFKRKLNQIKLH